jgi:hypothetical protein
MENFNLYLLMKNAYPAILEDIKLFKDELELLYFNYHKINNEYCYESIDDIIEGLNESKFKGYNNLKNNNCTHLIELIISNMISETNEYVKISSLEC